MKNENNLLFYPIIWNIKLDYLNQYFSYYIIIELTILFVQVYLFLY